MGVWVLYEKMRRTYGLSKNAVFNLSHSGQYVLCSVVDSERQIWHLGCDIEGVKQVRLMLPDVFLCVRISKNCRTEYGSGKSGGV
ncbi:MAG: hypothetical protein ACLTCI_10255 [[Clostridium] nexile]